MTNLIELARAYVALDDELAGACGPRAGELAIASMATQHDLILVAGGQCDCEEGTCPGLITRAEVLDAAG